MVEEKLLDPLEPSMSEDSEKEPRQQEARSEKTANKVKLTSDSSSEGSSLSADSSQSKSENKVSLDDEIRLKTSAPNISSAKKLSKSLRIKQEFEVSTSVFTTPFGDAVTVHTHCIYSHISRAFGLLKVCVLGIQVQWAFVLRFYRPFRLIILLK
jgi:hypothetical protein